MSQKAMLRSNQLSIFHSFAMLKITVENREPEQRLSPLKLVLEAEQYNVLCADNIADVQHLISRYPVNTVLIDADVKAQHYDCHAVAKEVKTRRAEVPVVMLSTKDWIDRESCEAADYNVAKGNSPVETIRAIEKLMGDAQLEVKVTNGNGALTRRPSPPSLYPA
jgi:DNA-binding NtrC family response regulator